MISGISASAGMDSAQTAEKNSNIQMQTSSRGFAKDMVLAKKGEAAYMVQMDIDGDGEITYEEFLDYCDKNSISESGRAELLEAMMKARLIQSVEEPEEKEEAEKDEDENDDNEKEDDAVSYDEYLNSLGENFKTETSNKEPAGDFAMKKALGAYFNKNSENSSLSLKIDKEA